MQSLLPCKSAAAREELLAALRREAGGSDAVPLKLFEPAAKDPGVAERPTGFRLALQRQHVSEALTLQRDLREALARLLPEPAAGEI